MLTYTLRCKSSYEYHSELAIPLNSTLEEIVFSQCHVSIRGNDTKKVKCRKWNFEENNGEVFDTIVTKVFCEFLFFPLLRVLSEFKSESVRAS